MKKKLAYLFTILILVFAVGWSGEGWDSSQRTTWDGAEWDSFTEANIPVPPEPPTFRFTITTAEGNDSFTLPIYNGGTYNFNVDWGDGKSDIITGFDETPVTHTYADSGATTYTVSITGTITGFRFNNLGDKLLIRVIKNWGPLIPISGSLFYGCANLTVEATDILDITNTTTINYSFRDTAITTIPGITGWDTSAITHWVGAFRNSSIDQDLGSLDITSMEFASDMFRQVTTLSTANYSALLVGFEAQDPNDDVVFHGGNSKYDAAPSAAATARAHLALATGSGGHSWIITDDGEE